MENANPNFIHHCEAQKWSKNIAILIIAVISFICIPFAYATTGDVIDNYSEITDYSNCISGPVNALKLIADVDGNGTGETMVLIKNIVGDALVMAGATNEYRFSAPNATNGCGTDGPTGEYHIVFIDTLAAGFNYNDPSTYTYTNLDSISIKYLVSEPLEISNVNIAAYQGASTITGTSTTVGLATKREFKDVSGIDSLVITTSLSKGISAWTTWPYLDSLILHNEPTNTAPEITNNGSAATASISVEENQTDVVDIDATDIDPGTTLVYSISGGADQSLFNINSGTGVLTFASAQNYEAPSDANTDGDYIVEITVSDGSLTDVQTWTVSLTNVNEAPVISNNGSAATASIGVQENQTSVVDIDATDVDASTTLTYSISGGADQSLFNINSGTGVLTFASAQNYEAPSDANTDGDYIVEITVSDGSLTDVQTWTVSLTNVNEAPEIVNNGSAPTASINVEEIQTSVADMDATDVDASTTLTYSISGGADQALFNINSGTGILTFSSAPDYEIPSDANTDGDYIVEITVSDGSLIDMQELTVTVDDVDPEVVCLIDLSGSMNWGYDGDQLVPVDRQRLTYAKKALIAFTNLYRTNFQDDANYGLAGFRASNSFMPPLCIDESYRIFSMDILNSMNHADLIADPSGTIMSLNANGSTPLLGGVDTAMNMFESDKEKVIVLLSDGQHNCPSRVLATSTEVQNLKAALSSANIKLYTIGFGQPYEVDEDLLDELAYVNTDGISGYYDVVDDAGLDPSSSVDDWDPETALALAYGKIFAEGCGFGETSDPLDIIDQGEIKEIDIPVSSYDNKMCFFISWVTSQAKYLDIKIHTSNGAELPLQHSDIIYNYNKNHTIITVSNNFLKQEGIVGLTPWKLKIDGSGIDSSEKFQYLVLNKSKNLTLNTWFDKTQYFTGDKMKIFLELKVDDQRLINPDKISIRATKPGDGLGNWLFSQKITVQKLEAKRKTEIDRITRFTLDQSKKMKLDTKQKEALLKNNINSLKDNLTQTRLKSRVMIEDLNIEYPRRAKIDGLQFNDQGRDGDEAAGDGIYTAVYKRLPKEGTYIFNISVNDTCDDRNIKRETRLQKYVRVKINPKKFIKSYTLADTIIKGKKVYNVNLKLKDRYGNVPSPYALRHFDLSLKNGETIGAIQANPDGTFTQMISVPENVKAGEIKLTMSAHDQTGNQRLNSGKYSWIYYTAAILLLIILGLLRKKKKT